MKIVMINGSLRKKNTFELLKKMKHKINHFDVEIIQLSSLVIKPCIGCENCMRNGNCHYNDDMDLITKKLIEADGIVIGSPIHLRQISGMLKVVIDRGCSWYHRSPLVGKPILFALTTQVTGINQTRAYLKDLSIQWGCKYSGCIVRNTFHSEVAIKEKELKKFLYHLNPNNYNKYKPKFKEIIEFQTQKVLAQEILPLDKEYWNEKGFFNKPYFYKCKIGIIKRIIGYLYYKLLSNIISNNKKENS